MKRLGPAVAEADAMAVDVVATGRKEVDVAAADIMRTFPPPFGFAVTALVSTTGFHPSGSVPTRRLSGSWRSTTEQNEVSVARTGGENGVDAGVLF